VAKAVSKKYLSGQQSKVDVTSYNNITFQLVDALAEGRINKKILPPAA